MGIMQYLKKYPSRIVSSYFKSHLSKYEHERTSIRVTAPISLRNLLSAPLTAGHQALWSLIAPRKPRQPAAPSQGLTSTLDPPLPAPT